jgi:hypothetical protein
VSSLGHVRQAAFMFMGWSYFHDVVHGMQAVTPELLSIAGHHV